MNRPMLIAPMIFCLFISASALPQQELSNIKNEVPDLLNYSLQITELAKDKIWPGFDLRKYAQAYFNSETSSHWIRFGINPTSQRFFYALNTQVYNLEKGLSLSFHEAFHAFERDPSREGTKWRVENSMLVMEYPDDFARNNALFSIEAQLLFLALKSESKDEARRIARQFISIRKVRQGSLSPELVELEKNLEVNEGIAEYVGDRAVVEGIRAVKEKKLSIPFQILHAQKYLLGKYDDLNHITHMGKSPRLRFYFTGPAQCFILDRLMPDWKRRVQMEGAVVQDLLEEAAQIKSNSSPSIVKSVLRQYDFDRILKDEERTAAKIRTARIARLDSILNRPGQSLIIDISEFERMGNYQGFDPQNVFILDGKKRVHTRMLMVAANGYYKANFELPVVEDTKNQQYLTVLPQNEAVKVLADGIPVDTSKPIEQNFSKSLVITSPNLNFEAKAGTLLVNEKGMLIRLVR